MEFDFKININEETLKTKVDTLAEKVVSEHIDNYFITSLIKRTVEAFIKDEVEVAVREVLAEKDALKKAVRKRLEVKMQKELERQLYAIQKLKEEDTDV